MYTVRWAGSALSELAEVWTVAGPPQRQAITAAANQIDRKLQEDPEKEGESRTAGARLSFVYPLAFRFEIVPGKSIVRVLHVWSYQRKGG